MSEDFNYMRLIIISVLLCLFGVDLTSQATITIKEICVETNCADGKDDDGDGLVDCEDMDCIVFAFDKSKKFKDLEECPVFSEEEINFYLEYCSGMNSNDRKSEEIHVSNMSDAASMEPKWGQLGTCQEIIDEVETLSTELAGLEIHEQVRLLADHFDCQALYTRSEGTLMYDDVKENHCTIPKYVYSYEYGWIDFHHVFIIYLWATEVFNEMAENPELISDLEAASVIAESKGYQGEVFQLMKNINSTNYSAFSYEDLCSNYIGATMFVNSFSKIKSGEWSWSQAISIMCTEVRTTKPQNAPNYDFIPHIHNEFYPREYFKGGCLTGDALRGEAAFQFCKRPAIEIKNIYEAQRLFPD